MDKYKNIYERLDTFAIAMMLGGLPIIYFLRDGIVVLPAGPLSTVIFSLGPLILSFGLKDYKKFFRPNPIGYFLGFFFIALTFGYFLLRDRYTRVNFNNEILNYGVISLMYVTFVFIDFKSIGSKIVKLLYWVSLLGCIGLIVYLTFIRPLTFGQRAAIEYQEGGSNPHVFGKAAYYGIITAILLLKNEAKFATKYFLIIILSFVLFLIVLILTQTYTSILATGLSLLLYLIYNFKTTIAGLKILFKKWYIIIGLVVGFLFLGKKIEENRQAIDFAFTYIDIRIKKTLNTLFDDKSTNTKTKGDVSAETRIHLFDTAMERLVENVDEGKLRYVIFGNGYAFYYLDNPQLEALDSFGILGFLFYSLVFLYCTKLAFSQLRNPAGMFEEFLAYSYFIILISNFAGGVLIDHVRWMYILLVFRIIMEKKKILKKPIS